MDGVRGEGNGVHEVCSLRVGLLLKRLNTIYSALHERLSLDTAIVLS